MIKITQNEHGGVQLEIDGFVVPELTHLSVDCPVDHPIKVQAHVLGTEPFALEVDTARVEIVYRTRFDFMEWARLCRAQENRPVRETATFLECLALELERVDAGVPR
jgi:hypothetical protein